MHTIADALEAEHLLLGDGEKEFVLSDDMLRMRQLFEREQQEEPLSCFDREAGDVL